MPRPATITRHRHKFVPVLGCSAVAASRSGIRGRGEQKWKSSANYIFEARFNRFRKRDSHSINKGRNGIAKPTD
jgi:hypothetical protein